MYYFSKQKEYVNNKNGFTLFEIILYVALSSIILFTIVLFFISFLGTREKTNVIREVDSAGNDIMRNVGIETRNASAVLSPTNGSSGSILRLQHGPTTTEFFVTDAVLYKGNGLSTTSLHSNDVQVTDFNVLNYTATSTNGNVRFMVTIQASSTSNRQEFQFENTFIGGASLRP